MNLSNQVTTALAYPFPNLTKITGKPTAATLKNFTKQVFTNARAIHCHQHGGHYGHLGLIMPDTPYQALTHVSSAWADTAIPNLPTFANTDDAVTIANRMERYRQTLARATTQNQVESDLKAQMLAAIDSEYLNALEDETLGFANVTAREIYAHLMDTYGVVKAKDIEANRARLSEPWTPDHTIESLWKRVKDCQDFATGAGEAIDDGVVIRLIKEVLRKSGVFENAIDKWDDKTTDNTTVAHLMAHFNTENERRLSKLTASQAGYNKTPVANLAEETSFARGYETGWNAAITGGHVGASHSANMANTSPTSSTSITDLQHCQAITPNGTKWYYCFTHGLGKNKTHTSATCNKPCDGHKRDATLENMMGGSSTVSILYNFVVRFNER